MASSSSSLKWVLFLLFLSLPIRASKSDSDLIKKTCKSTPYYNLCVSWLRSDPTSAGADTRGLAAIMLNAAAANATAISGYLSSQLLSCRASAGAGASAAQKVLRLCADKYSSANDSLQSAMQDLAMEMYDYAALEAAAAAAYPDACRNGFRRLPAVAYPAELAKRVVNLKRICAVAVGILDLLINQPK